MLQATQPIAIYMQDNLGSDYGKMGYGVMRFGNNPIRCVIDSRYAGQSTRAAGLPYDFPVVASIGEARALGAEVLILGIAPSGGQIPDSWAAPLREAVNLGMCIVNGLHDQLNPRYGQYLAPGQWLWDVRKPLFTPTIAGGRAAELGNKRVLMVGTDMAVGKMTVGLTLYRWFLDHRPHLRTEFLATGQIGITITGNGLPLDAFRVDHACGAVEHKVLELAAADVLFIEGQGSLLHPGSTATLPLMRGSCATHLLLCHRAGMTQLAHAVGAIKVPPLTEVIALNEAVANATGIHPPATTVGIAVDTHHLPADEAHKQIAQIERETGLPTQDVVRFDAQKLGDTLG